MSSDENPNKSAKNQIQSSSDNHDTLWKEKASEQKKVVSKRDKNDVEDVCDHVVAGYLKRNGFLDILAEFQSYRCMEKDKKRSAPSLEKLLSQAGAKSRSYKLFADQEKPFDAWSTIREGYSDLIEHLNVEDEVDRVVKYILDTNILVRHINIQFNILASWSSINKKESTRKFPGLKFDRFSRGPSGEDAQIKANWEKLVTDALIKNPAQCIEGFMKLEAKGGDRHTLRRRTVLGCYLAQNLPYVRHGINVYYRAVALVFPWNDGKYTQEEDATILREVERNGACQKTWIKLAEQLQRQFPSNIAHHFTLLTTGKSLNVGRWTTVDYETFMDIVFRKSTANVTGIEFVQSVSNSDIHEAAKALNRLPQNVYWNWRAYLRPLLLSYHYGTLHSDTRKQIFQYLVKNKVASVQEINWEDAKLFFPNHTATSLSGVLRVIRKEKKYVGIPLYMAIEDFMPKMKHSLEPENVKQQKEQIVHLYDKARGVLNKD